MRTTDKKFTCIDCKELRKLVIVRGSAIRCEPCYKARLVKRQVIRQINKLMRG